MFPRSIQYQFEGGNTGANTKVQSLQDISSLSVENTKTINMLFNVFVLTN